MSYLTSCQGKLINNYSYYTIGVKFILSRSKWVWLSGRPKIEILGRESGGLRLTRKAHFYVYRIRTPHWLFWTPQIKGRIIRPIFALTTCTFWDRAIILTGECYNAIYTGVGHKWSRVDAWMGVYDRGCSCSNIHSPGQIWNSRW